MVKQSMAEEDTVADEDDAAEEKEGLSTECHQQAAQILESFCKRTDLGSFPDPATRATSSLRVFIRSGPGR